MRLGEDRVVKIGVEVFVLAIAAVLLISLAKKWDKEDAKERYVDGTVAVYDYNGKKIGSYDGKFDIRMSNAGVVLKDLENGEKIVVSNATAVIEGTTKME